MGQVDNIIRAVGEGERAAASLLSLADRAAGLLGRGGPRWHHWRSMRLRLRAARVEEHRPDKALALRRRAAVHLHHALLLEGKGPMAFTEAAVTGQLLRGREPLACEPVEGESIEPTQVLDAFGRRKP